MPLTIEAKVACDYGEGCKETATATVFIEPGSPPTWEPPKGWKWVKYQFVSGGRFLCPKCAAIDE